MLNNQNYILIQYKSFSQSQLSWMDFARSVQIWNVCIFHTNTIWLWRKISALALITQSMNIHLEKQILFSSLKALECAFVENLLSVLAFLSQHTFVSKQKSSITWLQSAQNWMTSCLKNQNQSKRRLKSRIMMVCAPWVFLCYFFPFLIFISPLKIPAFLNIQGVQTQTRIK